MYQNSDLVLKIEIIRRIPRGLQKHARSSCSDTYNLSFHSILASIFTCRIPVRWGEVKLDVKRFVPFATKPRFKLQCRCLPFPIAALTLTRSPEKSLAAPKRCLRLPHSTMLVLFVQLRGESRFIPISVCSDIPAWFSPVRYPTYQYKLTCHRQRLRANSEYVLQTITSTMVTITGTQGR
jgi:hypothetical protein